MSNLEQITKLHQLLEEQNLMKKEILTVDQACLYLGISKSNLYKKTSANRIPHYKPEGKILYFLRTELDQWMLRNRQSTVEEIITKAAKATIRKGGIS